MRLIDADRLKRQVEGRSWRAKGKFIELIDASATIKSQTVQVSFGVKHGRLEWRKEKTIWQTGYYCSECQAFFGKDYDMVKYFNFCPHCGANMYELEGPE